MRPEQIESPTITRVVTLVHGTAARDAPWIKPDSSLSKALRARLGDGVAFFHFNWSGRNSHTARRLEALDLRDALLARVNSYPKAEHYLVCHSHGGDVAVRAVAGSCVEGQIAGVVCLATPFLIARERDLGRNKSEYLIGPIVILLLLTMLILDRLVVPSTWPGLVRGGLVVLVSVLAMSIVVAVLKEWRKYAENLLVNLTLPQISEDKLLIIRSPADEASGALGFSQLVSHVSVRLSLLAFQAYERFHAAAIRWSKQRLKMIAIAVVGFAVTIGCGFLASLIDRDSPSGSWFMVPALSAILLALFITIGALFVAVGRVDIVSIYFRFAASIVTWPVIAILSVMLLPFGWEVALANILLDVSAETTPLGSWRVHLVEPPTCTEIDRGMLPLMHSVIYENPRVADLICDWIKSRAKAAGGERLI